MTQPPFTISIKMLDLVAKIIEITAQFNASGHQEIDLHLQKNNRIRSIQSSLAIENNSLSLEQVTDIVNGKLVKGKQEEIKEVKNAYAAYDEILTYSPFKVGDFLHAHGLLTKGLVKESGRFRTGDVGIFAGQEVVHLGARPEFVSKLITELFNFAAKSELHPLIISSILHFEIEFIHPFADGNGRMGRLWQTLILSKWQEIFQWLPMETVIYSNQQTYYQKLAESDRTGESTVFVEFMLETILTTLQNYLKDESSSVKKTDRVDSFILQLIGKNQEITVNEMSRIIGKSTATINRHLKKLQEKQQIKRVGAAKGGEWELLDKSSSGE
ncbi:MAG: Fic family protein [Streptococcaceae bacterium]|jgi:Fic family protein|nr:Fic family protein [Streptococcaceae bacterium]